MSSYYVNQMLNEGLDFPMFAARCAPAMAVEHIYREVSASHDEEIAKGLKRVSELIALSPAEAEQRQAAKIADLEATMRKVWEQSVRVAAMRHQVEIWEPGKNEDAQGLKRFMLEELDRGPDAHLLKIHEEGIATIKAMTPKEYLETLYQNERRNIISHQEAKTIEAERAAEWRAWREALIAAGIPMGATNGT